MQIKAKGRVLDVFESNGNSYVTFNDVEMGGQFKLTLPGAGQVKIDSLLDIEAEVKPGIIKNNMFLKVTKILNSKGGD